MQMPWDNDPIVQPSTMGRQIYRQGAPQPTPQTPEQVTLDRLSAEEKRISIEESRAKADERRMKAAQLAAERENAANQIVNVMDKAFAAKEKSNNWFATGFGAGLAKNIGGTSAADVDALLDTIGANTAFETLQKMRAASPTGGALGSISERELDLLKSTVASLKQSQSDKQFRKSMQDVVNAYGRVLARLPGGKEIMRQRGWIGGKPQQQKKQSGSIQFLGFE